MENNQESTRLSSSSTFRPRKSIFTNSKPKPDNEDPKILLNGQSFEQNKNIKVQTSPNFYQSYPGQTRHVQTTHQTVIMNDFGRRTTGSFYLPENPLSRVIISNPAQTRCIRPSSLGRPVPVLLNPQINQNPVHVYSHTRVLPTQNTVLTNSRIYPSQTSNVIVSNVSVNHLKKKSILVQGRPSQRVVYRSHSPIKIAPQIITEQIMPEVSRVIIRDDPKTISQLNKLSSINQYLNHQYTIVNNELNFLKDHTQSKQFVDDNKFLQRSLNRIDDIFLRQTNQALHRLDEISRQSSSKGFTRGSSVSRVKRSTSHNEVVIIKNISSNYTPIKHVQHLRNSSYLNCPHRAQDHTDSYQNTNDIYQNQPDIYENA